MPTRDGEGVGVAPARVLGDAIAVRRSDQGANQVPDDLKFDRTKSMSTTHSRVRILPCTQRVIFVVSGSRLQLQLAGP